MTHWPNLLLSACLSLPSAVSGQGELSSCHYHGGCREHAATGAGWCWPEPQRQAGSALHLSQHGRSMWWALVPHCLTASLPVDSQRRHDAVQTPPRCVREAVAKRAPSCRHANKLTQFAKPHQTHTRHCRNDCLPRVGGIARVHATQLPPPVLDPALALV